MGKKHTLKYEVSRMGTPLGVNSRVLEWVRDMIVEPWPPPIVEPWRFWFLELFFWCCNLLFPTTSDIYGSCGSSYLESLVPIVLGTVQSARNSCHWKMCHFGSRISTCVYSTLRVFVALLFFSEHGSPKDKVSFLCVRRFMFTWAMDHGYEIIALAAQPPEPKHAKCINADKKQDARYQSPMQQEVLKWYLPTHSVDLSSPGQ